MGEGDLTLHRMLSRAPHLSIHAVCSTHAVLSLSDIKLTWTCVRACTRLEVAKAERSDTGHGDCSFEGLRERYHAKFECFNVPNMCTCVYDSISRESSSAYRALPVNDRSRIRASRVPRAP